MSEHVEHAEVDSAKTYLLVFAALIALTIVTTWVAFYDLGQLSVIVALGIATSKMLMVALYFMHLRHSTRLTRLIVVGALLWLVILLVFTMADVMTRGDLGVPGR